MIYFVICITIPGKLYCFVGINYITLFGKCGSNSESNRFEDALTRPTRCLHGKGKNNFRKIATSAMQILPFVIEYLLKNPVLRHT